MTTSPSADTRDPTPAAGLALFFAVIAAGTLLGWTLPEQASLVVMPVVVLVLTGVAIVVFRADARTTLHLKLPTAPDLFMAVPLAISFYILDDQLAGWSHDRYPVSAETLDYFRRLLTAETTSDWIAKIAVIGVGAAASEELMFRGFMQSAFLQRLPRSIAILLCAVLFMLLHVQFLPVFAAGIVLGYVTLATRSIVVPIFVHFANNVTQLLLFNLAGLETLGEPVWIPPTILVPAIVMFVLTMGYYARRLEPVPEQRDDPPERPEPRPLVLPRESTSLGDELASVAPARRRLGWAVVVVAVAVGFAVLGGLLATSVYYASPQRAKARLIDLLEEDVLESLDPRASSQASEITSAFRALHLLNDSGQLELEDLGNLWRDVRTLAADGVIDAEDADLFVEQVLDLAMTRTAPRKF